MIAVTGIICLLPSACFGNEVTLNLALKELLVLHHDLHHLSFARDGFVDQGTLVGQGTHEELLKTCEVYREIYRSQFPDEDAQAGPADVSGTQDSTSPAWGMA